MKKGASRAYFRLPGSISGGIETTPYMTATSKPHIPSAHKPTPTYPPPSPDYEFSLFTEIECPMDAALTGYNNIDCFYFSSSHDSFTDVGYFGSMIKGVDIFLDTDATSSELQLMGVFVGNVGGQAGWSFDDIYAACLDLFTLSIHFSEQYGDLLVMVDYFDDETVMIMFSE